MRSREQLLDRLGCILIVEMLCRVSQSVQKALLDGPPLRLDELDRCLDLQKGGREKTYLDFMNETHVDGRVLGKSTLGVNVIIEDDQGNHDLQAERNGLWLGELCCLRRRVEGRTR